MITFYQNVLRSLASKNHSAPLRRTFYFRITAPLSDTALNLPKRYLATEPTRPLESSSTINKPNNPVSQAEPTNKAITECKYTSQSQRGWWKKAQDGASFFSSIAQITLAVTTVVGGIYLYQSNFLKEKQKEWLRKADPANPNNKNEDVGNFNDLKDFFQNRYPSSGYYPYRKISRIDPTPSFLDIKDYNGWTLLHYAASCGREDIVQLLLENKSDITLKNFYDYKTVLHYAVDNRLEQKKGLKGNRRKTIEILLKDENIIDIINAVTSNKNETVLHDLAYYGGEDAAEIADMLIRAGADPNIRNEKNKLPYDIAEERKQDEKLKQVLARGSNQNRLKF